MCSKEQGFYGASETAVTNEDYWLHIVRNPWGHSEDKVRDARLHLADAFEKYRRRVTELEASAQKAQQIQQQKETAMKP
jgi:hypothetical protein